LFGSKRDVAIDSKSNRVFLGATYFFYFGLLGIFLPYVGLFLDDRGLDSVQIGTLLAITALFRILGPNLLAKQADKKGNLVEVLRIGCLLSLLVFTTVFFVHNYWLLTFTFCLMMMFYTAVLPPLEVITVNATAKSRGGYGRLRLWGSVGFIVCSMIAGSFIDVYGPSVLATLSCVSLLLIYISSLLIVNPQKTVHAESHAKGDWQQAFSLLFIVFILANILLQISFGSYYNFFALYMNDLQYTGMQTGAFIATGVLAEIVIFVYAVKLVKRFEVMHLLAISILLTAFRWLGLAYFAHLGAVIVLCQILHAFSFGLSHVASIFFLTNHFTPIFQSRAQAIYVSLSFGVGSAVGSYIAGLLWNNGAGSSISFVFSAGVAFAAALLLMLLMIYQNFMRKNGVQ
jgi:PPP family 3-phenylpropionic acid transporter